MKVLLLMADANMHKFRVFGRLKSAREAPLTLTTLAAIGADEPDIEFRLVDESVDRVPLDYPADLVASACSRGHRGGPTPWPTISAAAAFPWCWGGSTSASSPTRPPATPTPS